MSVYEATLAELEKHDAVDTVEGQIALNLARELDEPRNGMAVAGDARELRSVIAAVRDVSPREADSVDDASAAADAKLRLVSSAG
jgi:hypothetical protein